MTIIEEVREEVTIHPVLAHVYRPSMHRRIANFGFELEMLYSGDEYDEHEVSCDCGERCCQGYYMEEGSIPEGLEEILYQFRRANLTYAHERCCYHCSCRNCRYDRTTPFLAVQEDSTVGVEFVTKICSINSLEDQENIRSVVARLRHFYSGGQWLPDGDQSAGNHVHISSSGSDNGSSQTFMSARRNAAARMVNAIYAAMDWENAAGGGCGTVREYNSKPIPGGRVDDYGGWYGNWLSKREHTFEHRLWNTPSDPDRIIGHVAASLAITRWAFGVTFDAMDWAASTPARDMVEFVQSNWPALRTQISWYLPTVSDFAEQGSPDPGSGDAVTPTERAALTEVFDAVNAAHRALYLASGEFDRAWLYAACRHYVTVVTREATRQPESGPDQGAM